MNKYFNVLGVIALFAVFSIFACHNHSTGKNKGGKRYLTDVQVLEDNTVIATVNLPDYHYGFLLLNDSLVALEVVVADGPVNLGVFEPGDYTLCIELFVSPSGQAKLDDYWATHKRSHFTQPPFKDVTGHTECCDFTVFPLNVPPTDPPPTDPPPVDPPVGTNPKLKCRVNYDGAVVLIVKLRGYGPVILRKIGADYEYLVEENFRHIVEDLDCGEHGYVLLDPETEEELDRCVISIPCPPDDPPEDPEDPKTRYFVCHNGTQLLVPWHALKAHLTLHGDTLGVCDDDD